VVLALAIVPGKLLHRDLLGWRCMVLRQHGHGGGSGRGRRHRHRRAGVHREQTQQHRDQQEHTATGRPLHRSAAAHRSKSRSQDAPALLREGP